MTKYQMICINMTAETPQVFNRVLETEDQGQEQEGQSQKKNLQSQNMKSLPQDKDLVLQLKNHKEEQGHHLDI